MQLVHPSQLLWYQLCIECCCAAASSLASCFGTNHVASSLVPCSCLHAECALPAAMPQTHTLSAAEVFSMYYHLFWKGNTTLLRCWVNSQTAPMLLCVVQQCFVSVQLLRWQLCIACLQCSRVSPLVSCSGSKCALHCCGAKCDFSPLMV